MNLLLDTHILLWAASEPERLSQDARDLIQDPVHRVYFSAASIWEVVIKNGLGREDFHVDPHLLRRGLIENGYSELPVTSAHTLALAHLPPIHRGPFDRILIAQAEVEGFLLLTMDATILQYQGPIRSA
ncbi:MAG: type II toxin-antitoxin system VapC family toxin [Haliea sp.]|uniref:type II toxin-antitoxin system VapC family toxin n=1 Tax=Haliea sp. TaxID=1932666 RepID=UPI0032EABD77